MLNITEAQIADAVAGDIEAAGEIVKELTPRIYYVARDAASVNGHLDESQADDYASEAKVAVLLCFSKFTGSTAGAFSKFADKHISDAIAQARRVEANKGVVYDLSDGVIRTWERAVRQAGGDVFAAEELSQSEDLFGSNRLSAETAWRARIAAQPVVSLDAPQESGRTLSEELSDSAERNTPKPRTQDQQRVHDLLNNMRSQQRADVLRRAAGIDGNRNFGTEYRRRRNRKGEDTSTWVLKDPAAIAEDMGTTAQVVKSAWNEGKKTFANQWVAAYGVRKDERKSRELTAKGVALLAAIEENDQHVFVKHHGCYVEFKHINEELDIVCTWTSKSRAVELGLLAG
ncbi:hypothetical protein ACFPA8_07785 [Streptomyces ovatisporus]|uniref:RNA polymerase sigma-70 region 2 domain-containing protein n=1 Tax=Streptomyces ovatisporus TaxID=1128682 RepID=A0ABV9A551_9ACTN